MSMRHEWTSDTSVRYHAHGSVVGEHKVEEEGALTFASDGVIFVVQGSHEALRTMLTSAMEALPGDDRDYAYDPSEHRCWGPFADNDEANRFIESDKHLASWCAAIVGPRGTVYPPSAYHGQWPLGGDADPEAGLR